MTSPQLDRHAVAGSHVSSETSSSDASFSNGWEALRQPGARGIALFDVRNPRCLAADPLLCAVLGYGDGALDGVAITEIEVAHPFARSIAGWRRHVRNVRKAEQVLWFTWLTP